MVGLPRKAPGMQGQVTGQEQQAQTSNCTKGQNGLISRKGLWVHRSQSKGRTSRGLSLRDCRVQDKLGKGSVLIEKGLCSSGWGPSLEP